MTSVYGHGLIGPIEVGGKEYSGTVPMTPFGGMLTDEVIASVLTYVRNSFGNKAEPISAANVKNVRNDIKNKEGFYKLPKLLKISSMED
ncbi:MAG: c-type cytochrome [Chitinophagaceae bacterium]